MGVVGTLRAGSGTRTLGLRADMDALPIAETSGVPYASQTPGKMHACGHDGHTAMLLGAACHLAQTRNFSGTLNLIFQPAEEIGFNSGAERMIQEGLFDRFPCNAVFGMHNYPGYPSGTLMFRDGPFMAASSLVMVLQTLVARNTDPFAAAVVTVGAFNAGQAPNVIPPSARLALSVRSFDAEVRRALEQRICSLVESHVAGFGARAEIDYIPGYPVLINQQEQTEFASQVARDLLGEAQVVAPLPAIAGSEDFAYFLQQRPGCFLRGGNGDSAMLHQATYDFNDENLVVGAAYWSRLTEQYLQD